MMIPYIFDVIDFNSPVSCGHPDFERMADELQQNRLRALSRVPSGSRIPKVRRPIPRGIQGPAIYLSRPVPLHGLRQLTFRESLRDIETCLRAVRGKLYHMGIPGRVSP